MTYSYPYASEHSVRGNYRWDIVAGKDWLAGREKGDQHFHTLISFQTSSTSCVLPVLPEELSFETTAEHTTHKVINGKEVTLLNTNSPEEFTIVSFFPQDYHNYPFTMPYDRVQKNIHMTSQIGKFNEQAVYLDQKNYIKFFETAMEYGLPIRVFFWGLDARKGKADIFTIQSFTHTYRHGTGDVYFSLSFKEYHEAAIISAITTKIDANTGKIIAPPVSNPSSPPNSGKFATGDRVTATGIWTASSDGSGARGNAKAGVVYKIERVKSGATRPYHLATLGGTWQGWVAASQLKHA